MPFDLEAAINAPPAGWAVCRADSPFLPQWLKLFGRDHMPLTEPGIRLLGGFGKTRQRSVFVSADHMTDAELDRFAAASLPGDTPEAVANLARGYRATGLIIVGGQGVVAADTLEAARDLARREAYPERN